MTISLARRVSTLEKRTVESQKPTVDWAGLLEQLDDWPEHLILGKEEWYRVSEAGDRKPVRSNHSSVHDFHSTPTNGEVPRRPYYEFVPLARVEEIKFICKQVAERVRRNEFGTLIEAMGQLPDEPLRGLADCETSE